jgi:glycosyltransferase involved in cell wall biosynthesis
VSPSADSDRKLKVLSLVDALSVAGGGERFARQVTMHLDQDRFERFLCVSRWSPGFAADPGVAAALEDLRVAGVRFVGLERNSPLAIWSWRPLLSLLRQEPIDILHGHMFGSNVWAAILGSVARTPVVIAHEQTWSFEGKPLRRLLDRGLIARRVDAFIAVSNEDRRRMIEIEGIDPDLTVVMPNAIPTPPPPSGRDVRADLGIPSGDPVVGTVCVLRPQKALQVLVEASAILRGEFPSLKVLIAGDGPEREDLEALIHRLDLEGSVALLGRRTDVPDLIQAFDVAVSCSDFEGTPLAVMEYMEGGRPVVATRVGGVPDLIEDGVQGLLVERRDPEALARSVAELLRDPRRREEMGRRGRERRRREFDIEGAARRLGRLYEDLYAAARRDTSAAT